jgi:Ni/Fe-hydrogenase subunit HybB-like protein
MPLIGRLSGVIPGLLIVYLALRFITLFLSGGAGDLFDAGTKSIMFWVETLLYAAPIAMLLPKPNREKVGTVCLAAFLMLMAGAVYRFNAYLVGFSPGPGWSYFPAVPEIFITLGIVSVEIMGYLMFVKALPVLAEPEHA